MDILHEVIAWVVCKRVDKEYLISTSYWHSLSSLLHILANIFRATHKIDIFIFILTCAFVSQLL